MSSGFCDYLVGLADDRVNFESDIAFKSESTEALWQVSANRSLFFFARMTREALPHLRAQGIAIEGALVQRAQQTALKRIGEPRELAYLVALLVSSR